MSGCRHHDGQRDHCNCHAGENLDELQAEGERIGEMVRDTWLQLLYACDRKKVGEFADWSIRFYSFETRRHAERRVWYSTPSAEMFVQYGGKFWLVSTEMDGKYGPWLVVGYAEVEAEETAERTLTEESAERLARYDRLIEAAEEEVREAEEEYVDAESENADAHAFPHLFEVEASDGRLADATRLLADAKGALAAARADREDFLANWARFVVTPHAEADGAEGDTTHWKMWYGRQSDTLIVVEADTLDEAMRKAREVDWRYDAAQPMTGEEVREWLAGVMAWRCCW